MGQQQAASSAASSVDRSRVGLDGSGGKPPRPAPARSINHSKAGRLRVGMWTGVDIIALVLVVGIDRSIEGGANQSPWACSIAGPVWATRGPIIMKKKADDRDREPSLLLWLCWLDRSDRLRPCIIDPRYSWLWDRSIDSSGPSILLIRTPSNAQTNTGRGRKEEKEQHPSSPSPVKGASTHKQQQARCVGMYACIYTHIDSGLLNLPGVHSQLLIEPVGPLWMSVMPPCVPTPHPPMPTHPPYTPPTHPHPTQKHSSIHQPTPKQWPAGGGSARACCAWGGSPSPSSHIPTSNSSPSATSRQRGRRARGSPR